MRPLAASLFLFAATWPLLAGASAPEPSLVVQVGHAQSPDHGAVSPDGKLAATGGSDGLRLWHLASGRQLGRFEGSGSVKSVAFSPDGERVASAELRRIRIYDVATRTLLQTLVDKPAQTSGWGLGGEDEGMDNFVSVAFSPDGRELVSAGGSKILVWSLADGSIRQRIEGHSDWVNEVAWSPDGRRLLSGSDDDTARLWDARDGRELFSLAGHGDDVESVAYSPDGRLVATAASSQQDRTIRLWRARDGQLVAALEGHENAVQDIGFTPRGDQLVSGSAGGRKLRYWDVRTGAALRSAALNWGGTQWFAMHPDGGMLMGYYLFEKMEKLDGEGKPQTLIGSLGAAVSTVDLGPGLDTLAVGAWQGVSLWDLSTGARDKELGNHGLAIHGRENPGLGEPGVIEAMAFSPDGSRLAVGDRDNEITIRHLATGESVHVPWVPGESIAHSAALAFSHDGALLHAAAPDGVVRTWDAATGSLLRTVALAEGEAPRHLAASPDGRFLALATEAATHLWTASGEAVWRREGDMSRLAFTRDGGTLVAGDFSGGSSLVRVLPVTTPDAEGLVFHPGANSKDLVAAPDGSWVATAGLDGHVELWDGRSGKLLRKLEGHDSYIHALATSGDGRFIASGSADGTTRIWRVADGRPLATLVAFTDGRWVVMDEAGRFDTADLESVPGLHWVMPDDPFTPVPIEAFMRDYYEPRLLARLLAGEEFSPLPPVAALNRIQPEVRILSAQPDPSSPGSALVEVEVAPVARELRRDGRRQRVATGVHDLRLFRDGQLVGYRDGEVVPAGGKPARFRLPVRLPAGAGARTLRFSAYAFNDDRIKSPTAALEMAVPASPQPRRPRAILASIGVDLYQNAAWDLEFASNDARLINQGLADRLRATGRYEEVVTRVLASDIDTPEAATKENIGALLRSLATPGQDPAGNVLPVAGPDDVVILSFSGHGALAPDGQFHLLPHDIGEGRSRLMTPGVLARGISTDELGRWLRDVDAGELVLVIDACHAGATVDEGFKPGPMGSRGLGQLAFDKGMRILSATQADDVALESEATQQGLLSYALVNDGLASGLADFQPADGRILLPEWLHYAVQRVPGLSSEVYAGSVASKGGDAPRVVNSRSEQPPPPRGLQQPSLFDFRRDVGETTLLADEAGADAR